MPKCGEKKKQKAYHYGTHVRSLFPTHT